MQIKLPENIRAFRKTKKMTQEQLAEVLGVTVGAVSKWESGQSTPDITLIVEMAGLFETSVDVLLGYSLHRDQLEQSIAEIKRLRNLKDFEAGTTLAERTLQKFPNDFEAAFHCAVFFSMKAVEKNCFKSDRRANELYERALELIEQNTDPCINEWTINNKIAMIQLHLEKPDEAIRIMKQSNPDGINDGEIGFVYAVSKREPDEALPYLSDALISYTTKLYSTVIGYANAYCDKAEYKQATDIMLWIYDAISGLKKVGCSSFLEMECAQIMSGCASISATAKNVQSAREYLRRAIEHAQVFDEARDFGYSNMRFFHSKNNATAFSDFGTSAMDGIQNECCEPDVREILQPLFEELKSGIKQ